MSRRPITVVIFSGFFLTGYVVYIMGYFTARYCCRPAYVRAGKWFVLLAFLFGYDGGSRSWR